MYLTSNIDPVKIRIENIVASNSMLAPNGALDLLLNPLDNASIWIAKHNITMYVS
ncbi:hypothetical protein VEE78_14280 [Escherichia coli]|nr:hypothetical protein VEGS05_14470 [Escherichia coli]BED17195.1 hypothetical protein VEE78_14280 [Escherichia coli]